MRSASEIKLRVNDRIVHRLLPLELSLACLDDAEGVGWMAVARWGGWLRDGARLDGMSEGAIPLEREQVWVICRWGGSKRWEEGRMGGGRDYKGWDGEKPGW